MSASLAVSPRSADGHPAESPEVLPAALVRLLAPAPGAAADEVWAEFLAAYSPVLLKVASTFAPGYDGALDRYAYMLDELRRADCRRLRTYAADGRGRFSTWLAVVARRLCVDHYRQRYGRDRGTPGPGGPPGRSRAVRRGLSDLHGGAQDLSRLADTTLADPADQVDAHIRRAALLRAIDELGTSDQLLLRLRFEQELTAREIAPLLGLPSPFHVYRRLEAVCGILRGRLTARLGYASARGSRRMIPQRCRMAREDAKTCVPAGAGASAPGDGSRGQGGENRGRRAV
jgi:RNA polymerase sigma factor (sigma-70 family)